MLDYIHAHLFGRKYFIAMHFSAVCVEGVYEQGYYLGGSQDAANPFIRFIKALFWTGCLGAL